MEQDPIPASASHDFRCPTCGARQGLGDICRRCKCDLSLVVAVHRRREVLRRQCLRWLGSRQAEAALPTAEQLYALAPDADSARLLAVAQLACGDYPRALRTLVETI